MDRQLLRPVFRWGERILAVGVIGYLGWYIYHRWTDVAGSDLHFEWQPFLAASLCLLAFYVFYSHSWQKTLKAIDVSCVGLQASDLHRAFFVSFVTRYLPAGSLVNFGSRVELLKRLGGRRSVGLESLFYEQLYLVLGAIVLGLMSAMVKPLPNLPLSMAGLRGWGVIGVVGLIGGGLFLADWPLVSPPSWLRLSAISRRWTPVSLAHKAGFFLRFMLVNIAQGGAVYLVLRSLYPDLSLDMRWLLVVPAAYTVGRVVGQIAAVVPGGIGVREGAYTFLLSPFLPVQPVLLSAAVFRLMSVLLEALLAGVLLLAVRPPRQAGVSGAPSLVSEQEALAAEPRAEGTGGQGRQGDD